MTVGKDLQSATLMREKKVIVDIRKEIKRGVDIPVIESVDGFDAEFPEMYSKSISLRIFETEGQIRTNTKADTRGCSS